MSRIGLSATAHYLPERWLTAAEVGAASGIPEEVILEKFGLRGKHVAADDEHVSDLAVAAGRRLFDEQGIDPATIGAVVYYGSTWKDYAVWQAAPWIAHRLGCSNAYAIEYDNVSMGTPVALRLARALLTSEPELGKVLLVAASRESYLLDYANARSRFMFNFGDGAVAGLLEADGERNLLLGCHAITDGSFSLQVKVPAGGSVEPASHATVDGRRHYLDVADPAEMKGGLDEVSLTNFVAAAEGALARSGATLADVSYLCGIHMKRSMHEAIVAALGLPRERAAYLDDTGHMSGVDPLLALDRAVRAGEIVDGDLVLLLAAGTGYTWAASTVRWGAAGSDTAQTTEEKPNG
jgi:3-oxoacyl-[acyl-carrier-protein] synthase-3